MSTAYNYMSVAEAAKFLGLAKGTVYNMVAERKLPHYKPSGRVVFMREELEAFIQKHRVRTQEELAAEYEDSQKNRDAYYREKYYSEMKDDLIRESHENI